MNLTPEQIFEHHFLGAKNPATPIHVEYGWVWEGKRSGVAYELMRDEAGARWGVQALGWSGDPEPEPERSWRRNPQSYEIMDMRFVGRSKEHAQAHIEKWQKEFEE